MDYAYVANVNRIFGPADGGIQPADWRSDAHLLTSAFQARDWLLVGAFGYLLDIDNDNGPVNARSPPTLPRPG